MEKKQTKPSHGGKRPGAGRKSDGDQPKKTKAVSLSIDVARYLESQGNASSTVESAVRSTSGFLSWEKAHAGAHVASSHAQ